MSDLKLPMINSVSIAGRFVSDPHPLKATGDRVGASMTVAVNRFRVGKPNVTTYIDVVCWGPVAEAVLAHCVKGSAVLIGGSLGTHERKNERGPSTKVLQVSAASVQFLDRRVSTDEVSPD